MADTTAPNLETALRLARSGFAVFPCESGGDKAKQPKPFIKWRDVSTTDDTAIIKWWQKWPDAAIGLDLAKSGLVVIDCDRHGEDDGVEAYGALISEHGYDHARDPIVATPNKGTHFFYRQPSGQQLGNGRGALPPGIDVRGAGGYVIAPGTVMQDGRLYEVFGDIADAPVMPDWLTSIIAERKSVQEDRNSGISEPKTGHFEPRGNQSSDRSIAEIRDLLFCIPSDCGYDEWYQALMAVHAETGGSGQGLDLVDDWSSRGSKYRGRKEIETKWRSFKRSGVTGSTLAELARRYGADLSEIALRHMEQVEVPQSVVDSANAMLSRHLERRAAEVEADALPVARDSQFSTGGDWTRPGGLLQDIADWIESTSRRPNRPLAVAAAIGVVGTVCGRHIAGPTISGTHLYLICIGDTAIGKDRPLKAAKQILVGSGLPQLSVTGKFMSASAVENTVADHPCALAVVDEIGSALFAKMSHRRASTHESAIANALRELWSSSFDIFQTSARAQEQGREIMSPAFSIFGASTVAEFYNSLGSGVVENGLLNRFLIIRAAKRAKPVEVDPEALMDVPKEIAEGLLKLLPMDGQNMEIGAAVFSPTCQRKPLVVPWASDAVRQAFTDFDNDLLDRMDSDPEIAPYLGRAAEMTIRLATIYAVSRFGRFAEITRDALEWGMALATESAQTMMDDIREQIVENDHQAKYKLVEKIVRDAGMIRHRDIGKKINGRISRIDLANILLSLCDAGKAVEKPGENGKGKTYQWVKGTG